MQHLKLIKNSQKSDNLQYNTLHAIFEETKLKPTWHDMSNDGPLTVKYYRSIDLKTKLSRRNDGILSAIICVLEEVKAQQFCF